MKTTKLTFSYTDSLDCPIATFYKSLGYQYVAVGPNTVTFDCQTHSMPARLLKVSRNLSFVHAKNKGARFTRYDIINAAKD